MKKKLLLFLSLFLSSGILFSQEKESKLSFSATTDFAYYTKSQYISGDNHFSPIISAYEKIECRTNIFANYRIPTPLGKSWLVNNAALTLQGAFELTPISIRPQFNIVFEPFPFLILKTGTSIGSAWSMLGLEPLSLLNESTKEYEILPFGKYSYYDFWAQGIFQFDTGALIPGDWTHVIMQAKYMLSYKSFIGIKDKEIYTWQSTPNKSNGLQYEACFILGYQMPLVLYRTGLMIELYGHFDANDYGKYAESYDGDFMETRWSPFMQFNFGKKDELYVTCAFATRRSYLENHTKPQEEVFLTKSGIEWYFQRIALSWTHYF